MLKADCRSRMIAPFSGTGTYTRSRCMAVGQIWTRQIPFGGERYRLLQKAEESVRPGLSWPGKDSGSGVGLKRAISNRHWWAVHL